VTKEQPNPTIKPEQQAAQPRASRKAAPAKRHRDSGKKNKKKAK
jgi:hypothetical protein